MPEQARPNQSANQEQAEGSRENITGSGAGGRDASGPTSDRSSQGTTSGFSSEDAGGGITNRPLDEEQENQAAVPPRGQNKHDAER